MTDYIRLGVTVDFHTVLEAAAERDDDKNHGCGVNVNPKKSEKHSFAANDSIVVLAETRSAR